MNITRLLPIVWACISLFFAHSCSTEEEDNGNASGGVSRAYLSHDVVICQKTGSGGEQARIITEGNKNASFTATITQGGEFCSFDIGSKVSERMCSVGQMGVYLYLDANNGDDERQVTIHVKFDDNSVDETLYLIQQGYSVSATYDRHRWAELPQHENNVDYIYKTYYTTLASSAAKVRNYTICYDSKKHVAQWVAYPMHTCYTTPSVGRTDKWSYDPNEYMPYISQASQQYITNGAYGTGHNRGHMLPSASRYSTVATNEQTFYATNMMPQHGGFNSGQWAKLESLVRSNMSSDTLYVVTGTYFGDDYTIHDRKGTEIAVPSHAYKVLLRAKGRIPEGKTIADLPADELQAIGFWFPNPKLSEKATVTVAEAVCTVAEIEAKTGFNYFKMLKSDVAKAVKQQKKTSDWSGI